MLLVVALVVEDNTPFHPSRQSNFGVCHMHVPGFAAAAAAAGTRAGFRSPVAAAGSENEFLLFGG